GGGSVRGGASLLAAQEPAGEGDERARGEDEHGGVDGQAIADKRPGEDVNGGVDGGKEDENEGRMDEDLPELAPPESAQQAGKHEGPQQAKTEEAREVADKAGFGAWPKHEVGRDAAE